MCAGASNIGKPDKPRYKHIIGNKKKPFLAWSQYKKEPQKKKKKKRKKQTTKKPQKNKKQRKKGLKVMKKRVDGDYFLCFDPMIGYNEANPSPPPHPNPPKKR